jgi:DNA repair exonuclease SbcCD nuclease subunit
MKGTPMARLLIASDLHLSDRIWKHKPIEGDSYYSWKQIVEIAVAQKVNGLVLAGDILDKQVNLSRPIQQLLKGLKTLNEAGIPVYFNQGQHEYQISPWMLINPTDNVTWLHNNVVDFYGWNLVGCDYQNEEKLKEFLQSPQAKAADILVCHQVWLEFMGEHAKPQGSFADVPNNVKYLITGDYHEHIVAKQSRESTDLIILSPGSTHLRSLSEPVEKEIFLLDLEQKQPVRNLALRTRQLFKLTLEKGATIKQIENKIANLIELGAEQNKKLPAELQKPILQVIYSQADADLIAKINEKFSETLHLFFKPLGTSFEKEEQVLSKAGNNKVDLLSCLETFVIKENNPLVYSLALTMLTAPDAEQALKRWIEEKTNV